MAMRDLFRVGVQRDVLGQNLLRVLCGAAFLALIGCAAKKPCADQELMDSYRARLERFNQVNEDGSLR